MQPPLWSSVTPHFCKMGRLDCMASKGPSRRDSPLIKIAPPHPRHVFQQNYPLERVECISCPLDLAMVMWLDLADGLWKEQSCGNSGMKPQWHRMFLLASLYPDSCCPLAPAPVGTHVGQTWAQLAAWSPAHLTCKQKQSHWTRPFSQLNHSLVNLRINAYSCNMTEYGYDLSCGPTVAIASTLLFISSKLPVAPPADWDMQSTTTAETKPLPDRL